MISAQDLFRAILMSPIFLLALTIHEYAHAWAARKFGDRTAEEQGRLTLDPRAHIDPVGLVCFFLSAFVGFGVGWAKPVPVRLGNCKHPLRAMFWVAAAGPLSNLLQALVGLLVLLILGLAGVPVIEGLTTGVDPVFEQSGLGLARIIACLVGYYVLINLILATFNMIPVPPLDGGRILVSIAPYRLARFVAGLEQYGMMILLGLMFFGVLQYVYVPLALLLGYLVIAMQSMGIG